MFDGKIWVIGGLSGTFKNDVWYSSDGINWTEATSSADWSVRYNHESIVYNDKICVMGGRNYHNMLNDLWYSVDGINWVEVIDSADWEPREKFSALVYDDKVWIMGGTDSEYFNDVWYTLDGITWTEANNSADWLPRRG